MREEGGVLLRVRISRLDPGEVVAPLFDPLQLPRPVTRLLVGQEEVDAAARGAGDEEAQFLAHHGEDVRVLLLAQAGEQVVLGQQPRESVAQWCHGESRRVVTVSTFEPACTNRVGTG